MTATDSNDIHARIAALATEAEQCTRCGLVKTRNKFVFGEGNPVTPMVFVGEGPGETEDQTGRPFVGRAGLLLDECMREVKITRKHGYVCNVVRCRACVMDGGRLKNRPPTTDEAGACEPWLRRTLEIIKPLVIVCLGGPSASTLIHSDFKITRERGHFYETVYGPIAMATWHPSYVIRQEGAAFAQVRAQLVADIDAARRKVIELRKAAG